MNYKYPYGCSLPLLRILGLTVNMPKKFEDEDEEEEG